MQSRICKRRGWIKRMNSVGGETVNCVFCWGSATIVSVSLDRTVVLKKKRASENSRCVSSSKICVCKSCLCKFFLQPAPLFHFTLTELLSLPLDIPALMIHTWINHTVRQTAAYYVIMQIRETALGHAIPAPACFLNAASGIIRSSALACATDMHHWVTTIRSLTRVSFLTKLIMKM